MLLNPEQIQLRLRILEISHESHVSHLGSALSVVDIIAAIYKVKRTEERFILSAGHSGVALYAVLERYGLMRSPSLNELHVHPDKDPPSGIDVSTGSLGQGLPIGLGIALADRSRNVWVVSTDGEMAEGSMWESLRIASELGLANVRLFINANGFGAYGAIENGPLEERIRAFGWQTVSIDGHSQEELRSAATVSNCSSGVPRAVIARTTSEQLPFLKGLDAHYHVMTEANFLLGKEFLSQESQSRSARPLARV